MINERAGPAALSRPIFFPCILSAFSVYRHPDPIEEICTKKNKHTHSTSPALPSQPYQPREPSTTAATHLTSPHLTSPHYRTSTRSLARSGPGTRETDPKARWPKRRFQTCDARAPLPFARARARARVLAALRSAALRCMFWQHESCGAVRTCLVERASEGTAGTIEARRVRRGWL
jgi:hypothetical protein